MPKRRSNSTCSIFKNSRRLGELRNPGTRRGPKGGILTISFELDGQRFTALNGGPRTSSLRQSRSSCVATRRLTWITTGRKLTAGGSEIACGWLKDKFGLCWQIVPARLPELLRHPKAMQAMMKMKKLDIAELERAAQW